MLATVRVGEPAPDAVTALWKDAWAERVELQPLSRAETDELVTAILGGPSGPLELHAIWEVSGGSPLYVDELIRAAQESAVLTQEGGRWRLRGPLPVGGRLGELIRLRIERLSEEARSDLDVVALGEPVPIEAIEGWTTVAGLAEVEQAGLIAIAPEGGPMVARMTHPVFGEAVRSLLPGARRRHLAAQLANGYERRGVHRPEDLLRCVTWRLESGENGPPEMLVSGARQAAELLDFRLSERLASAALSVAPKDAGATLALAESLFRQRRYDEMVTELDRIDSDEDAARVEIAIMKAKGLWFGLHDPAAADAVLLAADKVMTAEGPRQGVVAFRAKLQAARGFPAEALALARTVTADAEQEPLATLHALGAVAIGSAFSGRVSDAMAAADRWHEPRLAAARRSDELSDWGATGAWVGVFLAGDIEQARPMGAHSWTSAFSAAMPGSWRRDRWRWGG